MKKQIALMALGIALISTPALANVAGGPHHDRGDRVQCREKGRNTDHCQRAAWRKDRVRAEESEFFAQGGTDLNSNRWMDGSPRSTLPPHASRGSERPSTDPNSGYWIKW
jgi:hypothetical protein